MGEKVLVEGQISEAIELVKELDGRSSSPSFAAWYFYDDAEDWRFLIAGPAFDALLPKEEARAYQIVIEAMKVSEVSSMSIADVKLLRSESPLVRAVGFIVRTGPDALMRAHFTDNYINGIFLKEMFVLRSAGGPAVPST